VSVWEEWAWKAPISKGLVIAAGIATFGVANWLRPEAELLGTVNGKEESLWPAPWSPLDSGVVVNFLTSTPHVTLQTIQSMNLAILEAFPKAHVGYGTDRDPETEKFDLVFEIDSGLSEDERAASSDRLFDIIESNPSLRAALFDVTLDIR
jgi:hypothetical protein